MRTAILLAVLVALGGVFLYLNRDTRTASALPPVTMDGIKRQVANDAIAQYEIAKRNGSAMDRCAQAMGVKAALLQAKDEAGYALWTKTERTDCAAAAAR